MTFWVLFGLVIAVPLALPWLIEISRAPIDKHARANAPGELVKLSRGTTHFQWRGPEDGPVIVCVHGLTTPSFVWNSIASTLAKSGYRVLTYDLYGRGYSDRPFGAQTPDFFLRQLSELLDSQSIAEPVTLFGYSMGGAITTAFAAEYPDRVARAVLLAPAGMLPVRTEKTKFMLETPVIGTWLMMMRYPEMLRAGIQAEAHLPKTVPGLAKLQAAELDNRGFLPAVISSLRGMLKNEFKTAHETIHACKIPVLAIWGGEDDVIAISAKDKLGQWNPDALQEVIADAGHGVGYTHTDQVLESVARFFEKTA
ncbi:MAG: alpha/beta fold hydrolase [Roseobacter sp.]